MNPSDFIFDIYIYSDVSVIRGVKLTTPVKNT
jgi:hypothetical protein